MLQTCILGSLWFTNQRSPTSFPRREKDFFIYYYTKCWLSGWRTGSRILCPRETGSIPGMASYLVWDGGQSRDSVRSARVYVALNVYLGKSGEGKQ